MDAVRDDSRAVSRGLRAGWRCAGVLLLVATGTAVIIAPPPLWLNAASDDTAERPESLVDVRIEGNTTIPASHIAKYIRTRPGRTFSQKQIQDDVKSLFGTRWFYSVEPRFRKTKKGTVLIFRVIERPVVRSVTYKGNDNVATKHLAKITGLKKGSPYSVSANRESVRRIEQHYYQKGYIKARVTLERGGKQGNNRDVIFKISEGAKVRVGWITFTGNNFVSNAVLRTKVRTSTAILWMFSGLFDPKTIPDDIAALKQYYHNLGFFDVKITNKQRYNAKGTLVTLVYNIKEGPRYKVRRIIFDGNKVLPTHNLRGDLTMLPGQHFNARFLAKDIDYIKEKYGKLGRMFARVEAAPRFLENQPGVADLVYKIDEDHVYRIRRINIVFRDRFPHTMRSVALNRMLIHPGDLADPKLIKRSQARIRGFGVFDNGRQNPSKAPQIIAKRVKPITVADAFRGQNNDSFPVSNNATSGTPLASTRSGSSNARENASVGRRSNRFTNYRPGSDPFDISDVNSDGTIRRLPRIPQLPENDEPREDPLPFTDGPQPIFYMKTKFRGQSFQGGLGQQGNPLLNSDPNRAIPGPDPARPLDLDVQLNETQTGRLMFGVGVNSDAGVVGSIVLNEYNFSILRPPTSWQDVRDGTAFRGGGEQLRIELVPGNIVSRYLVSWRSPFFLDTDYNVSLSGFYYNRFLPDWDEERAGGRVGIGRQWTPTLSTSVTFRAENVDISNPDLPTPGILAQAVGDNLLTSVGFSISHDTRDQAFLPGEGHLVELLFEQAVGEFNYPRLVLSGSQYFTVYQRPDGQGRHLLTLRGQLGWTGTGTPVFERFYAGGFQTFRGFDFRGVTPRISGIGVGGRWMALGTVEYMIPLLANETIQGVAFTDFGTVENKFGFDDFRLSVGVGLRVTIPALGPVPLAFDFGFPLLKENFDDRRVFNFYVGVTR